MMKEEKWLLSFINEGRKMNAQLYAMKEQKWMLLHLESHLDRCNNLDNQNTSDSVSSSRKNKMTSLEKLTIQLQLVAQALHMFLPEQ